MYYSVTDTSFHLSHFVDQLPLRTINSKIQMDGHESQEEEEEERELTDEEKDGLMKILKAMSSQLEPFLKMD